MTDRTGMFFRWAWGLFHLGGMAAWAIWGPKAFQVYMWGFFILELAGVLFGRPMTRSVRGILKDTRPRPVAGSVVVAVVAMWSYAFAVGCTLFGPFPVVVNAFLVMLIFGIWIIPHFVGDRWG